VKLKSYKSKLFTSPRFIVCEKKKKNINNRFGTAEKKSLKFKGRVQCFSMQVVINKCFLLKPWKKFWRKYVLSFSRKRQKNTLLFQKLMSPIRRLNYSN